MLHLAVSCESVGAVPARPTFHKVLDAVLTYGSRELDQRDVARLSGTAEATVSKGRKSRNGFGPLLLGTPVRFSSEMGLVLAISVGSESVRAGLVDANGKIHHPHSAPAQRDQLVLSPGDLFARIGQQVILVLNDAFETGELLRDDRTLPLLAAALALPAPVDRDHRLRGYALTHPDWGARDPERITSSSATLNDRLASALGAPFTAKTAQVMNDCNAAAVAMAFERVRNIEPPRESLKDPRRERSMAIVLRVSGGIGAGMIEIAGDKDAPHVSRFLKSRVMVGTNGLAGELGHLPVSRSAVEHLNAQSESFTGLLPIDYEVKCSCERPHHLQALAGWHAVARRIGLPVDSSTKTLTEMLDPYLNPARGEEDQNAVRALEDAGKLIGRALTGPVLALDPHAVTVIGALAVPPLVDGLKEARGHWRKAFWTGRTVSFEAPYYGSKFMALRGAGLALLRAQRHRKLREIAEGRWDDLAPLLPYSRDHLLQLTETVSAA